MGAEDLWLVILMRRELVESGKDSFTNLPKSEALVSG